MRWLAILFLSGIWSNGQTTILLSTNQIVPVPCYPGDTSGSCIGWQHTNVISVATTECIQILNYKGNSSPYYGLRIVKDGSDYPFDITDAPAVLCGPLKLHHFDGFLTYKIGPKEEPIQPGTGVVIPSDATGPVEIILESSADLVSWVASVPGIYGANTTNRFFRVRAVRQ